jgi:hypothetical protein
MSDNTENEVPETPEEKPKKPRKPRAKKPAPAPVEAAPVEKPKRAAKGTKLAHAVTHEGKTITVTGTDVYVRKMTSEQMTSFGIKHVDGVLGKPCAESVVLTFKSPAAASKFFAESFTTEDEAAEFIVAGSKTDWNSDTMNDIFG